MNKEMHVRNGHKWKRCAILALAIAVAPAIGAARPSLAHADTGSTAVATATTVLPSPDGNKWK